MHVEIRDCVHKELDMVLKLIEESTDSDISLIKAIQAYVLAQPERKLIRPLVLLLQANAVSCQKKEYLHLAAIIELIHGATLLHDDVIDKADMRRNKITTHRLYGTSQSILMGDFIYASAFNLISKIKDPEITHILAQATKEIVEGEILQLSLQGSPSIKLEDYNKIICAKTAKLFITGSRCIEHLGKLKHKALSDYSYHFGMLYQLTDDILDVDIDNKQLNKAHGTDLKEGKMTLPTYLAYHSGSLDDRDTIRKILNQELSWEAILPILRKTKAIENCKPYLEKHLNSGKAALDILPESTYKSHLLQLLSHIPERKR